MNKKKIFFFIFFYFTQIIFSYGTQHNFYLDFSIQIYKNNKKKISTKYEEYLNKVSFISNKTEIISLSFDFKKVFFKTKKNNFEFLSYVNNFSKNYNSITYYDHMIINSNLNIQSLNINFNFIRKKNQQIKYSILFLSHYRIKNFFSFFSWGGGINYNIFTLTLNNSLLENNIFNIDNKYQYFYEEKFSLLNQYLFFYVFSLCVFSYKNNNYMIDIIYELENNIKINNLEFLSYRKYKIYNLVFSIKYYII